MLLIVTLAQAGTWPICAQTETAATVNGGWSLVEQRSSDGDDDSHRGTWYSEAEVSMSFGGRRDENYCASDDGLMGLTRRWTSDMVAVVGLPGAAEGACEAAIWASGRASGSARAEVDVSRMTAYARGSAVTTADADNVADISVDAGGGARFTGQWAWRVGQARNAEVVGSVVVGQAAAYAGASLEVPGWARVDTWDGEVDAWVRRGDTWVHVEGSAPMTLSFGAVVAARGTVCATGSATSGSQAAAGEGGAGGAAISFSMDPVATASVTDAVPVDGPEFGACGCE